MGGSVGLKGTDGIDTLRKAIQLGATPTAPRRAVEALRELSPLRDSIELVTYPHDMGEEECKECGFNPVVIGYVERGKTSAADTKRAAEEMLLREVDLLLFTGGDGTARNIHEAVGQRLPVIGVPAGVKIHSSVFAINPRTAGQLAIAYLRGEVRLREAEVMDVDEEAFRQDRVSARLHGYLKIPYDAQLVQSVKVGSALDEDESMQAIAWEIVESMRDECLYIIGPGTTAKAVMKALHLEYTLLGVDVVQKKRLIVKDANEARLLELIEDGEAKIIVSVIGGQGYVFGRGNQQISSRVIRKVGKDNIVIVATESKMAALKGMPLLVDTGDREVDEMLKGYCRVVTGYRRSAVYRIA
ncbi:ATP-NAD kinase family protein [Candidatus Bathyarchaeota archaeon]|nr:ATP-NAD kinase family protein [Candidatus Bathyarchaeota archaeon]